jgi:heme/copper-type cytochrome/quinol oxidase subunit 2
MKSSWQIAEKYETKILATVIPAVFVYFLLFLARGDPNKKNLIHLMKISIFFLATEWRWIFITRKILA